MRGSAARYKVLLTHRRGCRGALFGPLARWPYQLGATFPTYRTGGRAVTGRIWLDVIISLAAALLLSWLALVIALAIRRPKGDLLKESLRLLPDLLRLLRRLTTNRDLPSGVRVRVALLFVYLAIPIDVIPDFIPILGYADDAIVVVLVLRGVCRRVSLEELREAWPGSDDGFAVLCQLVRPAAVASSKRIPGQNIRSIMVSCQPKIKSSAPNSTGKP
jgi:uncharacterized membrane protein YkvA (DUF1232 family)